MKATLKDYALLHFIVFIWGFTAILGKLIHLPALEIVTYRTLFSFIGLWLLLVLKKRDFSIGRADQLKILGNGMLIGLHWILFFASAKVSNVSVCLAGLATTSLWTSFLEPLIGKRKIKLFEVLLGTLVIVGLYVIFRFEFNHLLGLLLALGSALLAAIFSIINSRFAVRNDHYMITYYEMIGAFLISIIGLVGYAFLSEEHYQIQWVGTSSDYMYLLILALVCTIYPFAVAVELMKRLTVFTINLTVNLEPVYGILLAVIIFKGEEKMSTGFYIGTLIILASVIIHPVITRQMNRKALKSSI